MSLGIKAKMKRSSSHPIPDLFFHFFCKPESEKCKLRIQMNFGEEF